MTIIRFLLYIASSQNWFIHQLDINTSFLHDNVFDKNLVCKLNLSICDLRQDSSKWNHKLTSFLIGLGYTQSKFDYSLFTKKHNSCYTSIC